MSTEKMREYFEAWICGLWPGVSISRNPDNSAMFAGSYRDERVHMAWKGWQASRAAIEVELPVPYESFSGVFHAEDGEDPDLSMGAHDVREAIDALGMRVKP